MKQFDLSDYITRLEVTENGDVERRYILVPNDERVEEQFVDIEEQPAFNGRITKIQYEQLGFEW